MNLRNYSDKMSEEQLNSRIALFCGYLKLNTKDLAEGLKALGQEVPDMKNISYWVNSAGQIVQLPNYCRDLNEIHEAEKMLWRKGGGMLWSDYASTLRSVTDANFEITDVDVRPIFAVARERAEAFVAMLDMKEVK